MKKTILPLAAGILLLSCAMPRKNSKAANAVVTVSKTDTAKKDSAVKIKPYKDVITNKAITDDGLFKVHKVADRYYFEIPDSLFKRDILIVNRIAKGAAGLKPLKGQQGYAGDWIGENVIEIEKSPEQKIFFRRVFYLDISKDSTENGMHRAVDNSSLLPIIASFDIKAYSPDSSGVVIDLTDFIKGDNDIFFFHPQIKKQLTLTGLQTDKSYIADIRSFPLNTEVRTVKTYTSEADFSGVRNSLSATYELNTSIILLPNEPMRPRYFDERVGYFFNWYRNFDASRGVEPTAKINRWRIEPAQEDLSKYRQGVLVEPQKPIVFYVDPATPKKWVPFIIRGVNAWQKAFEKIGFKNAIYALEAPVNDSTWSLDDARHNAIVYMAADFANAMGPHVSDPRTGEILESHIAWYHNVVQLLHDWYMVQAGPNDPRARKMEFDDSLMGRLIQYVITHEVGHTLGLLHNFRASSSVPVDSLRSKTYVAQNGHTPSIMDYARFNYVAQPEDSIDVKDLIPRIGVYDEWAIEWGYKLLPDFKSDTEEKKFINKWVVDRLESDPRVVFSDGTKRDALSKSEDLGNDAAKAGTYGIKNLERVMANLMEWTRTPGKNYDALRRLQLTVLMQYSTYISHVIQEISGVSLLPKTVEQSNPPIVFLSRERQRADVQFLQKQFFNAPRCFDAKETFGYSGWVGEVWIYKLQEYWMTLLIDPQVWNLMLFNEIHQPANNSYGFDELLNDLESGIWKELKNHQPVELERRNLQKIYVYKLNQFIRYQKDGDFGMLDACTIIEDHIGKLYHKINNALPGYKDRTSIAHLTDLRDRLKKALNVQKGVYPDIPVQNNKAFNFQHFDTPKGIFSDKYFNPQRGCFEFANSDWLNDK